MFEIETIKPEKALQIIETRFPTGLFIAKDGEKYIAIDNMTADAWTEEFFSLYVANLWLTDEMDTEEAQQADNAIKRVAEAIQSHPWYEHYTMEQCREFAEYQIMKLRDSQKQKGAK